MLQLLAAFVSLATPAYAYTDIPIASHGHLEKLRFNSDGSKLLAEDEDHVYVLDGKTWALERTIPAERRERCFAVSHTDLAIVQGEKEGHLLLIDLKSGESRDVFREGLSIDRCDISYDGTRALIVDWTGEALIYDIAKGTFQSVFKHEFSVYESSLSKDGTKIVLAGDDGEGNSRGRVFVVDIASGAVWQRSYHGKLLRAGSLSNDGKVVGIVDEISKLRFIDVESGREHSSGLEDSAIDEVSFTGHVTFSSDGKHAAAFISGCDDSGIFSGPSKVVELELGTWHARDITEMRTPEWNYFHTQVEFSANSDLFAIGTRVGAYVYESGGKRSAITSPDEDVYALAFSPDLLATALEGRIRIQDMAEVRAQLGVPDERPLGIADYQGVFHPDKACQKYYPDWAKPITIRLSSNGKSLEIYSSESPAPGATPSVVLDPGHHSGDGSHWNTRVSYNGIRKEIQSGRDRYLNELQYWTANRFELIDGYRVGGNADKRYCTYTR